MIVLIDNFDSFSYNLQDYLRRRGNEVHTIRYDRFKLENIEWDKVKGLVISPGPGTPSQYPIHFELYKRFLGKIPILGVCLGFQSIGEYLGASLIKAEVPMHGKVSSIRHNGTGIFKNIASPTKVTRYHSLVISKLPNCLLPTAETLKGELMAFKHESFLAEGVQFHPEAHLTEFGVEMMINWLEQVNNSKRAINTEEINVL